jgi:CAAX protease family protein
MTNVGPARGGAVAALLTYAALWGASVASLARAGADWTTPVMVMAIFGLGLSGTAWLLTRGADTPVIPVAKPALESAAMLIYLIAYAVLFLGFGMSAARAALPSGPAQQMLVLGAKLAVHVAAPALLLTLLGARLGPLFQAGLSGRKFWRTLAVLGAIILGLLCVISPSLRNIGETGAAPAVLVWAAPASFIWIAVEAGLNEEFLFRAVLQTRLSAWFKSPWAGVFVTALVFALAHTPGLFLRGGPGVDGWSPDPLQVAAYTIATLSPLGLLFGLIYARTKSLLLVVLLHGLVDVLPNMAEFIRIWT